MGFSRVNQALWGTFIYGNHHINGHATAINTDLNGKIIEIGVVLIVGILVATACNHGIPWHTMAARVTSQYITMFAGWRVLACSLSTHHRRLILAGSMGITEVRDENSWESSLTNQSFFWFNPFYFGLHSFCSHFCSSNPSLFAVQHPSKWCTIWFMQSCKHRWVSLIGPCPIFNMSL